MCVARFEDETDEEFELQCIATHYNKESSFKNIILTIIALCNTDRQRYSPLIWNWHVAIIYGPVCIQNAMIIELLIQHTGRYMVKAYGDEYRRLLLRVSSTVSNGQINQLKDPQYLALQNDFLGRCVRIYYDRSAQIEMYDIIRHIYDNIWAALTNEPHKKYIIME